MNYKSIADLNLDVLRWLPRLPNDIDVIVGVPRSGMLVATILALQLNRPLTDLEGFLSGRIISSGQHKKTAWGNDFLSETRTALILDDSVLSGREMNRVRSLVEESKTKHKVYYGAPYIVPNVTTLVDFYYEKLPIPRIFEWNLMHASILAQSCVDIDGVLCEDPTELQNDDGERYRDFLANAPLRIRPTGRIYKLVSSRLEKYRDLTEEWLQKNRIEYDELVLLDLPDRETRMRLKAHGPFKAEIYKSCEAVLFIESNPSQAREIASISGKWVVCVETAECFSPSSAAAMVHASKNRFQVLRHLPRQFASKVYRSFIKK